MPARVDLSTGRLYIESLSYLGIEEVDSIPYYIFTYANNAKDCSEFIITSSGTLVSNNFSLVATPDMQNLYWWLNASRTEFVPVTITRARSTTASGRDAHIAHKGELIINNDNKKISKKICN